ncbi:MAG: rod shape-determining protein MreC [Elusimicrobiota bacterium]
MSGNNFSRRNSVFAFLLLTALSVFLLTARLNEYVLNLKSFLFYVFIPSPQAATRTIQVTQKLFGNIGEIVHVHQENITLRKELERFVQLENEWKRASDENLRLRELVNFPRFSRFTQVKAKVISREPDDWFQSVIIDKGKASGLYIDAPVLALTKNRPVVLGRIGEAYGNSSKVVLITNILSAIPAMISSTGNDGLLEGQDSPRLTLNYLLPDRRYNIGDEVVTSPLSSVFPSGILIGRISDTNDSGEESFKSVVIKPAINLNNLREVVILIPEKR